MFSPCHSLMLLLYAIFSTLGCLQAWQFLLHLLVSALAHPTYCHVCYHILSCGTILPLDCSDS